MEFATQGKICSYCHQRDYLPFDCIRCEHSFCLAHRTRESHECPSLVVDAVHDQQPPAPIALPPKIKCHHRGCKVKEISPNFCRNCAHSFCLKHRFPTSHACEAFGQGLGRNTILKAGLVPPRPIRDTHSTDSSTGIVAGVHKHGEHVSVPAQPSILAAAPASIAAVPTTAASVATLSPTSSLMNANSLGQSCAAEVAAAANRGSTAATAASLSISPDESTAATSSGNSTARRQNTNVAHLSKLLRQKA